MSESSAFKRGLEGKSTARDALSHTFGSLKTPEKERAAFEQGKIERTRLQAEEKSREKSKDK